MILLLSSFQTFASDEIDIKCTGWGTDKTFELEAQLEESKGNYLDGYLNIKAFDRGQLVYEKNNIDATGFFWIDDVRSVPVYLAEMIPINRLDFKFLSIAANHPILSGNSYLTIENVEYLAECSAK